MLVAIGLSAFILVGISWHMVSLGNIWMHRGQQNFFPQHVEGVRLFLTQAITQSEGLPEQGGEDRDRRRRFGEDDEDQPQTDRERSRQRAAERANRGAPGQAEARAPVEWRQPPSDSELDDPLLAFSLRETPYLLNFPDLPLPGVWCYLLFDRRVGLGLLWHSRLEEIEDDNDLRNTLISRWVTDLEYGYYDEERDRWEITDEPERDNDDNPLVPQFLLLTFTYENEEQRVPIYLPAQGQGVPLF